MSDWWRKGVAFPKENENFLKILEFYLLKCPVKFIAVKKDGTKKLKLVSKRAVTFEDRNWIGGNITTLYTELTRNITVECVNNENSVEETRVHIEESSKLKDSNFDMIIFKKDWRINKTKSIFYSIRNAFAHGTFSVLENNGNTIYYFENESSETIKAQIRLKENTLLKWIDLFYSSANEIREKNKSKKNKLKKNSKQTNK